MAQMSPLRRRMIEDMTIRKIVCVKFSKWRSWVGWLCGLAEVGFLVLLKIAHVEVAVGFEPVFVGLDG